MKERLVALCVAGLLPAGLTDIRAVQAPRPDVVVSAEGAGDHRTLQAALSAIPATNSERIVVLVRNGTYREKIRIQAPFVTLRGEDRNATRIEFSQLNDDFTAHADELGRAVINIHADDFVLENLTVENTAGVIGPHAFTLYGKGDRTVIVDCNIWSHGADTLSLWLSDRGRYYHARCDVRGSVDFVCPRGWCYATDCTFHELKATAALWHDGSANRDMKFVLRNCRLDGVQGWNLARHHHDAQFYLLDCTFSATMNDRAPFRVIYPLNGGPPSDADMRRNRELDKSNLWGERSFFHNCHRDGGDYAWHADNIASAPGAPRPDAITAAWTFGGTWDPERKPGPRAQSVSVPLKGMVALRFDENVTVKGSPRLKLRDGSFAIYQSGSGSEALMFATPESVQPEVASLDLNGGAIIATEAAALLRHASIEIPAPSHQP